MSLILMECFAPGETPGSAAIAELVLEAVKNDNYKTVVLCQDSERVAEMMLDLRRYYAVDSIRLRNVHTVSPGEPVSGKGPFGRLMSFVPGSSDTWSALLNQRGSGANIWELPSVKEPSELESLLRQYHESCDAMPWRTAESAALGVQMFVRPNYEGTGLSLESAAALIARLRKYIQYRLEKEGKDNG